MASQKGITKFDIMQTLFNKASSEPANLLVTTCYNYFYFTSWLLRVFIHAFYAWFLHCYHVKLHAFTLYKVVYIVDCKLPIL